MTGRTVPAGPVLVIAPHPDDETLGCGGLISLCTRRCDRLHVVFVTDGGASHRNSVLWDRSRLAACREKEAAEALMRLGAGACERTFLRLPDASMPALHTEAYDRAKASLVSIIGELRPGLAVVPWRRDPHCDHRDAWSLTMDCLDTAGQSPEVLEYAIWLDELGSPDDHPHKSEMERMAIDISSELAAKRDAVMAHLSQLGELITDDLSAFVLSEQTIERLTDREEIYWRPCECA